uniref:Uncharacterized protein n=1 Tax=Varanus komodoensis TaxID=61221 RepID=A0A8D2LP94_VARKO
LLCCTSLLEFLSERGVAYKCSKYIFFKLTTSGPHQTDSVSLLILPKLPCLLPCPFFPVSLSHAPFQLPGSPLLRYWQACSPGDRSKSPPPSMGEGYRVETFSLFL